MSLKISHPRIAVCAGVLGLGLIAVPHLRFLAGGAVPVLQALVPAACLVLLIAALLLAVFRRLLAAGVLTVAVVLTALPTLNPPVSNTVGADLTAESCIEERQLTVLTLNVLGGGADLGDLVGQIRHSEPDLVVLTEADDSVMEVLRDHRIDDALPHIQPETLQTAPAGTVVLSRHPLSESDPLLLRSGAFQHPVFTIELPEVSQEAGRLTVAGIHPYPPVNGAGHWEVDLEVIGQWQREQQGPLILAGDFNAGHSHAVFRDATSGLDNTATANSRLPVPTWPAGGRIPAFTAIDHILVRGLQPVSWERFTVPGTDHHGVVATVCAS